MRDGPVPQKTGIFTETWKGTYEKNPVAIKILKIPEGQKDYDKIKTVRQGFPRIQTESNFSPFLVQFRDFTKRRSFGSG